MVAYYPYIKRLIDIIFAASALTLLWPLFSVIALFVKLDSDGPVFFKQERTGREMKQFLLIKFRTMTCQPSSNRAQFNPGDSCRVTRIGAILRRTKVDELPELFNVLIGNMSIVGPRPEVKKYIDLFTDKYQSILLVRPGLSDHASIKYRNEEELLSEQEDPESWYCDVILPDKLRLAQKYVQSITFGKDAAILWGTMVILFSTRRKIFRVNSEGEIKSAET